MLARGVAECAEPVKPDPAVWPIRRGAACGARVARQKGGSSRRGRRKQRPYRTRACFLDGAHSFFKLAKLQAPKVPHAHGRSIADVLHLHRKPHLCERSPAQTEPPQRGTKIRENDPVFCAFLCLFVATVWAAALLRSARSPGHRCGPVSSHFRLLSSRLSRCYAPGRFRPDHGVGFITAQHTLCPSHKV